MDKDEAYALLNSHNSYQRLQGARFFLRNASPEDEVLLREAFQRESVSWIRNAIERSISNLTEVQEIDRSEPFNWQSDDEVYTQAYSIAVEETSKRILHEFEPILGALKIATKLEIKNHMESDTWKLLMRFEALMDSISRLSKSASPPRYKEFDLSEVARATALDECKGLDVKIQFTGKQSLYVTSDINLVEIILRNGMRNAIEATLEVKEDDRRNIVLSWGDTDKDIWISILDRGIGLPVGGHRVWEIGTSTKSGHYGMGLPIALQASKTLGSEISLKPREDGGTQYEFRWPKASIGA